MIKSLNKDVGSSLEEADSRMMLHAAHIAHSGNKKKNLSAHLTQILGCGSSMTRGEDDEVLVFFDTCEIFKFLAILEMAWPLDPKKDITDDLCFCWL